MRAGQLRHRVEIQSRAATRTRGQVTEAWTTYTTGWASIEPRSGRELERAHMVVADATHKVGIRYYSGVSTRDRFLFGTRKLNIASVVNVEERDRELILICVEQT